MRAPHALTSIYVSVLLTIYPRGGASLPRNLLARAISRSFLPARKTRRGCTHTPQLLNSSRGSTPSEFLYNSILRIDSIEALDIRPRQQTQTND